jgi:hypothetical protein
MQGFVKSVDKRGRVVLLVSWRREHLKGNKMIIRPRGNTSEDTDRPQLRPIYDAIIENAGMLGRVTIQARKTYVSLVSPRWTFDRVQRTTRTRVDLGLRLEGSKPRGRLRPSRIHDTMAVQIRLTAPEEVDAEVLEWLRRVYEENC